MVRIATSLGGFMPPGAALHICGTTRANPVDDGCSVVDSHFKVWRTENLFVGGCGVIPTQNATNPTLMAACFAIVGARKMAQELKQVRVGYDASCNPAISHDGITATCGGALRGTAVRYGWHKLIDSTNTVVQHWQRIGKELGIDPNDILQTAHGRRTFDALKIICPKKATMEYATHIEKSILENYGSDATIIPGARDARQSQRLVPALGHCHVRLATLAQRLGPGPRPAHLPAPRHRQSVEDGKPDPAGYLLGMKKLAIKDPAGCAVFEDRPAGIRAGKTAGCKVVALATSHTAEQVAEANPDRVVDDFSSVALV
ncbi:glycerol-3-phosphate phosphatase [Cordyceps fumosorosea ARSEF 2679]|uniref:Glycerol-3-phosphate phosphatase n=1 Tax=Cordyceps fumosorosea (strain ARSEF 2679) TaxID=1081104 RepID=A0A167PKD8_CORFA|nr:glycerol-3-phosphate phosphatase [Cordyceps fumosorosea ARSEF 2679]OAA56749.1 glycerol-3-phosphate phosphatase [Cordyceps fumosorosea ARSEF 2679]